MNKKKQIWTEINMGLDDVGERDPMDIIKKDFCGNEDAYLRRMAQHHGISLS